jgi:hypothetical protein
MELDQYAAESEENKKFVADYTNPEIVLKEGKDSYTWYNEETHARIIQGVTGGVAFTNSYWVQL